MLIPIYTCRNKTNNEHNTKCNVYCIDLLLLPSTPITLAHKDKQNKKHHVEINRNQLGYESCQYWIDAT